MKKTKVVIPALGIIAFATAASITGTVAWFTASRSVTITAGEFAVINTKDNLSLTMANGIGTTANNEAKTITVAARSMLTDGSVDHTNTTKPTIIAPDASGVNVGKIVDYDTNTAADLQRGTYVESEQTYTVYTAFTWDMTFTVSFAGSQDRKVGLYLDLTQDTWAHEAYVADGTESATGWFDNADLSTAATASEGKLINGRKYFKAAPDDTGKAFKIAFIPKTIPASSFGVTKIWSPHQTAANSDFIDCDRPADYSTTKADYHAGDLVYYNNAVYSRKADAAAAENPFVPANWNAVTLASKSLAASTSNLSEETATTSLTNGTWSAAAVTAGNIVMNGNSAGVPLDGADSSVSALSGKANYLGYFNPNPNNDVSLTFRCVAYYEGTDPNITADSETIYETMTTSLRFGVATLSD